MADHAGSYDVIQDWNLQPGERPDRVDMDPFWVLAIVRLGMPLSFSRAKMASVTKDLSQGALLRAEKPLVITDDCVGVSVNGSKKSHKKQLSAFLKQTDVNYLVEILPGDWCFCWIVNNRSDYLDLLRAIDRGDPCNEFNSGLKFVGRVDSAPRKSIDVDGESGVKTVNYSMTCVGFDELDTMFFYDNSLASKDVLERDLGQWLARIGLDVEAIFRDAGAFGVKQDNSNILIPTLLDLIVGKGPSKSGDIGVDAAGGQTVTATPTLENEAPYSYLIPTMAGSLLGKRPADASKHVLAYADILELLQGVQSYSNKNGTSVFIPDLSSDSTSQRRKTPNDLLGTFLPFMPEFTNKPLWSVMQQYLNPTVNEMYTALRVNPDGRIMPTIVMRQIPFTTEAFPQTATLAGDGEGPTGSTETRNIAVTRFMSLPRWEVPALLVRHLDVGRSNATRTNMVHIYGSSAYQANNAPIQYQIVNNPPIRDDLDIMRSGLRPYMATVECWVGDQVGLVAGSWMKLVADWTIGSHLTFNGSVTLVGIQSPICEGDNVVFDDTVFHIESVSHSANINTGSGKKQWHTTLTLTNGMRLGGLGVDDENEAASGLWPIYPGFQKDDNTAFDPGLTLEQRRTTGGDSQRTPHFDPEAETRAEEAASQLDPNAQQDQIAPRKTSQSKRRKRR